MFSYEKYLEKQDSLSFEKALEIYNKIMNSADIDDDDFKELWDDVISYASEYVKIRNEWNMLTRDNKNLKDSLRTSKHNAFISTLTPLERYMKLKGWDTSWLSDLGSTDDKNRKRLGDFAGYLLCIGTLNAR